MLPHSVVRAVIGFVTVMVIATLSRPYGQDGAAPSSAADATSPGLGARFQYAFVPEPDVVATADVVVRGRVVAVSEPRWNQDSGQPWSMDRDRPTDLEHPPGAFPLQSVTLSVDEVWRGGADALEPTVEFVVLGTGIGESWNVDGRFLVPGSEVVALLDRRAIGWRDGPDGRKEVLTLSGAYQGVYRVDSGDRLRNAAADRLPAGAEPDSGDRAATVRDLQALVDAASPDA